MKVLLCISFFFSFLSHSNISYYPKEFYELGLDESIKGLSKTEVKSYLVDILDYIHVKTRGNDTITPRCPDRKSNFCYEHVVLDYSREVRPLIMAILPEKQRESSGMVTEPYCLEQYEVKKVGDRYIYPEHTQYNVEHTWPQSKFNNRYNQKAQKSDLYNLYPVKNKANSHRGSHDFGEFPGHDHAISFCDASELHLKNGKFYFEPPNEHKGNVARSVLYFHLKWEIDLSHRQIELFKKWHELDPVDDTEFARAEMIYKFQKNRNPFIDYPHLVEIF